ncbi:hypothetical protein CBR_g3446 [Chara braunii]|uniref:Uncharacterized protein n=1 Tax=Chara braunii TaxID=69332 RepID=A0A388JR70_CHABU|nr:hypothetical protein CBR_g3446 [Chara braunii]|eukprot:GBG60202.1 hypothetical protein CBR_g3446 [Chara braunii]
MGRGGWWSQAVPNKTAELADFQKVADLMVGFEQSLVQEGLISLPDAAETANESAPAEEKIASGESEGTTHGDVAGGRSSDAGAVGRASSSREVSAAQVLLLSTFAADVDVHFAVKKRKRVLVKARDLLMNSDFAPVVVAAVRGWWSQAVPNKTAELADFQKVADLTVGFEQSLVQEGLISLPDTVETANESAPAEEKIASGESEGTTHGDAAGGKSSDTGAVGRASSSREVSAAQVLLLSTFAADVDVHFAVKKRKRVLVKARDLLMNSDFAPVVVGDDCVVS